MCYNMIIKTTEDIHQDQQPENDTRATTKGIIKKMEDCNNFYNVHCTNTVQIIASYQSVPQI